MFSEEYDGITHITVIRIYRNATFAYLHIHNLTTSIKML